MNADLIQRIEEYLSVCHEKPIPYCYKESADLLREALAALKEGRATFSCDECGSAITVPPGAALLFGPPSSERLTEKRHLCHECYALMKLKK